MEIKSIAKRKVRTLGALLFATLMAGCYGGGWGGGPGYYSNDGYGSYGNSYYSNNVYRGYGGYPQPGLFGGYPPAHEAWDASTRGRTSYGGREREGGGGGHARSGGYGGGGVNHGNGGSGEHGEKSDHGH